MAIASVCLIAAGSLVAAAPANAASTGAAQAAPKVHRNLTAISPVFVDPGQPAHLQGTGMPGAQVIVSTQSGGNSNSAQVSFDGTWAMDFAYPWHGTGQTLNVDQIVDGHPSGHASIDVILNAYPIRCTVPTAFLSRSNAAGATQLYTRDLTHPNAPEEPFGGPWQGNGLTTVLDAFGYDNASEQLYSIANAFDFDGRRALTVTDGRGLSRDVGFVDGLPQNRFFNSGTIYDGALWVASQGAPTFYRIELDTLYAEPHTFTGGTWASSDWTVGTDPGIVWGHNLVGFQRVNLATGRVDTFPTPNIPSNDAVAGGMFSYQNGDLGLSSDSGAITRVSVANPASASPTFTVVSTSSGGAGTNIDATSCLPTRGR